MDRYERERERGKGGGSGIEVLLRFFLFSYVVSLFLCFRGVLFPPHTSPPPHTAKKYLKHIILSLHFQCFFFHPEILRAALIAQRPANCGFVGCVTATPDNQLTVLIGCYRCTRSWSCMLKCTRSCWPFPWCVAGRLRRKSLLAATSPPRSRSTFQPADVPSRYSH